MRKHDRYNRSEKGRARNHRFKQGRLLRGLCERCGVEPLASQTKCWGCLNYFEDRRALAIG